MPVHAHTPLEVLVREARALVQLWRRERPSDAATPSWSRGQIDILQDLLDGGPRTVPQLAKERGVTRQHVQVLADRLAADGLLEFVSNPAHRRSKLLRLTPSGEVVVTSTQPGDADRIQRALSQVTDADLATAISVLERLRQGLEPSESGCDGDPHDAASKSDPARDGELPVNLL